MEILLGVAFAVLAMLGWGIVGFLDKKVVKKYGVFQTPIVSQVIGLIPVFFIFLFTGFQIPTAGTAFIVIFSAFITAIAFLSYFKGLGIGQTSIVTTISSASSVVAVILGITILNEKLVFNQIIGIILVVTGVLLISFKRTKKLREVAKGIPFGLISMFCWGFSSFFDVFILKEISIFALAFYLRIIGVLFLLASAKFKKIKFSFPKKNILLLLIIIGILDIASLIFFLQGLKIGLLCLVGSIGNSYAVVTVILAYFFLKERLSKNQRTGVILLILGIILASVIF